MYWFERWTTIRAVRYATTFNLPLYNYAPCARLLLSSDQVPLRGQHCGSSELEALRTKTVIYFAHEEGVGRRWAMSAVHRIQKE